MTRVNFDNSSLTTLLKSLKPQYLRSKSLLAPNEIKDSRVVSQHLRKMLNTPQQLTRNSQNKSSFNYYDTGQTKYQLTIPRIHLWIGWNKRDFESFKNYFEKILKLGKGEDSFLVTKGLWPRERNSGEGGLLLPFFTEEKTLKSVDNYRKYMSWLLRICYETHQEDPQGWGWVFPWKRRRLCWTNSFLWRNE